MSRIGWSEWSHGIIPPASSEMREDGIPFASNTASARFASIVFEKVRITNRSSLTRVSTARRAYCGVMRAVFCGWIMMCAHGFPGYMIHGPPSTGFAVSPVEAGVAYGV